jgi:DNA-directed RNA polymerase subunit RPC12/RpoP
MAHPPRPPPAQPTPGKGPNRPWPMPSGGSESKQIDVLAHYELEGFSGQFASRRGGRILCLACSRESKPQEVLCFALHRLEGASDPAEMMAVAALECPHCGSRGTLTLTYGPTAPRRDAHILRHLNDARGATGIRPGM